MNSQTLQLSPEIAKLQTEVSTLEKEQSSSIYGISITVSKADVLEYIGLCGYPECGDEIQSLPEDKDYVIFADGD